MSQSRNTLEQKRFNIIEKIEETAKLIDENKRNKSNTITDLNLLESQIRFREDLIRNIGFEIAQADSIMEERQVKLDSIHSNIIVLQGRYSQLLRMIYLKRQSQNSLGMLLSSKGLNDAFSRWTYARQYESSNQRQAMKLLQSHLKASKELEQLQFYKEQRKKLMNFEKEHHSILEEELEAKNKMVNLFARNEKELSKELSTYYANREALNREIETLIFNELASGIKTEFNPNAVAEPAAAGSSTTERKTTASSSFANNRGRLPWPVDNGVIVQRYGKQKHPTIKNLEISNNGIDIAAGKGTTVKSIYKGKVIGVSFIPGFDNMVIIQHGNYYSVYSKLKEVFVKKGAAIQAGDTIGRLGSGEKGGSPELHFEIWKGKKKRNPELWLKKK